MSYAARAPIVSALPHLGCLLCHELSSHLVQLGRALVSVRTHHLNGMDKYKCTHLGTLCKNGVALCQMGPYQIKLWAKCHGNLPVQVRLNLIFLELDPSQDSANAD